MKTWHYKRVKKRQFKVGDEVLVLLPIPNHPLQARYHGPYVIIKKVSEVDYVVNTPGWRKAQRLCHINILKEYIRRPGELAANQVVTPLMMHADAASEEREAIDQSQDSNKMTETVPKLKNSDVLKNLQKEKLSHLTTKEQDEMMELVFQFVGLFPDTPT